MGTTSLLIIGLYLVATIIIGIVFRGRQESAQDYFTTSGGLSNWLGSTLVGLSVAATLFSGITFLSLPSVVYGGDLSIVLGLLGFVMAFIMMRYWFLPKFLRGGYTQPYQVLQERFGESTRLVAAAMFVLLRVGWMSALIYAPTLALMAALQLGDGWFWPLILTIGLSSTVYTVLGGLRGVIVTDALQFGVYFVGIIGVFVWVALNLPSGATGGDFSGFVAENAGSFDFSFDLSAATVWVVFIGLTFGFFGQYAADQMSLQRYLALGDLRSNTRSFALNIVGSAIVFAALLGIGLVMALWFGSVSDPNVPTAPDQVFPYFLGTQLPPVLGGMILAAILAATMSSMTSGINALSATVTLDFRRRFGPPMTEAQRLRFARMTSLIAGLAATGIAGFVSQLGTIFEITQAILGLFLGPLFAVFVFALGRRVLRSAAVVAGMIGGSAVGIALTFSSVYASWVAPAAFASTIALILVLNYVLDLTGFAQPRRPEEQRADSASVDGSQPVARSGAKEHG